MFEDLYSNLSEILTIHVEMIMLLFVPVDSKRTDLQVQNPML